jgi:outer membrane receptor protein involved in Fe transport
LFSDGESLLAGWMRSACFLVLISALTNSATAQVFQITGTVQDQTGAAIASATVAFHSSQLTLTTTTGPDGKFLFAGVADTSGTIRVTANGFKRFEQQWSEATGVGSLILVLQLSPQKEGIVVSATRSEIKLSEVPGSVMQLAPVDLQANAGLTVDDMLRQLPGFSLFRRSSSRVANPTTQGVSLRGLGASGPSRALVLEDGVPMVDPFGGWVYWDRIPRAELSGVEVARGGASSLYGSQALGGVVQFLSRVPTAPAASIDVSYGGENTPNLSAWAGTALSRWDMEASTDMSRTDGYVLVPGSQRGIVDTAANSEHATVDASLGYKVGDSGRAFLRGGFFDESRHNGTPLQRNSTTAGFGAAGIHTGIGANDSITARIYGQAQGYDQTFSSISATRSSETLTNIQHVPSQQVGTALQWEHILKGHALMAGLDLQEVMGASDERLVSISAINIAGGRQRSAGIFGQDIFRIGSQLTVIAGMRWDDWTNFHGSTVRIPASGPLVSQAFLDRSETSFSPRVSLLRALSGNLSFVLSGYRAFRAPTLNELYRSFRQGITVTNNNPLLRAERLTGAETGLRATAFGKRLEARGTFFWGDIVNPVTNVTTSSTPTLITRQRQNLGRTRSLGAELDTVFT